MTVHRLINTNHCPTCWASICTTCGHPLEFHIGSATVERFCTINTPDDGCDCKADPRDPDALAGRTGG